MAASLRSVSKTNQEVKCGKCDGRGVLTAFAHLDNGRCYACKGAGTVTVSKAPMTAAKKRDLDAEIMWFIEAGTVNNGTAYEIANRLRRLQCTESALSYLDSMKPAMRAAVIAKGRDLRDNAQAYE